MQNHSWVLIGVFHVAVGIGSKESSSQAAQEHQICVSLWNHGCTEGKGGAVSRAPDRRRSTESGAAMSPCICKSYSCSRSSSKASMASQTACDGSYFALMEGRDTLSPATNAASVPASCGAARSCAEHTTPSDLPFNQSPCSWARGSLLHGVHLRGSPFSYLLALALP